MLSQSEVLTYLYKDMTFNEKVHNYANRALALYAKEGPKGFQKFIEDLKNSKSMLLITLAFNTRVFRRPRS